MKNYHADIIIVGGGNAALCAAITARENQANVLLLESSPMEWRGGNSIHIRNMRVAHSSPTRILTESYSIEEFWADLKQVTQNKTNPKLAKLIINKSQELCNWLESREMHFQASISGTLSLSRTNAFF